MEQEDNIQNNYGEEGTGGLLPLGIYEFEYMFIPQLLQAFKQETTHPAFLLMNLANKELILKTISDLGYIQLFNPDDFNVETRFLRKETVIIYTFPQPFRMPLAKYGAIVIRDNAADYYTLERTELFETGGIGWMLGKTSDIHANFGTVNDCETPDDFLNLLYSKGFIRSLVMESEIEGEEVPKKGLWSKIKKFFN